MTNSVLLLISLRDFYRFMTEVDPDYADQPIHYIINFIEIVLGLSPSQVGWVLTQLVLVFLILVTVIIVLVNVAFYTIAERKLMAAVQRRKGPNLVGFLGLLQPFADGFKLVIKEIILPSKANKVIFLFAPLLSLSISFINWMLVTSSAEDMVININLSLLVFFAVSSFNVYSVILSGWASNSRYPFLGSLRAASQMISYEVSLTVVFLTIALCAGGSFNLHKIVTFQNNLKFFGPLFPIFIIFLISILAETNRAPFDLPEAEAEIVAGYNVEYSSITFALFFLGEYSNMLLMSALTVMLFLGGWTLPELTGEGFWTYRFSTVEPIVFEFVFAIKVIFIATIFIFVRATFPRIRYDQIMVLGWCVFLPLTTSIFLFVMALKISFGTFLVSGFSVIYR